MIATAERTGSKLTDTFRQSEEGNGSIVPQEYCLGVDVLASGDIVVLIQEFWRSGLAPGYRVQAEFCTHSGGGNKPELLTPLSDLRVGMKNDNTGEVGAEGLVCPEDIVVLLMGDGAAQRLKIEIVNGNVEVGLVAHTSRNTLEHERAKYSFRNSPHTVVALGKAAVIARERGYDVFGRDGAKFRETESTYDERHGLRFA